VIEICGKTISQHAILKADHSIGARLSLMNISRVIILFIIASSIVFIITSINIGLILQ